MDQHQYIEQQRSVCAMGAYETLLAIEGVVPVLHSGRGCGVKLNNALGGANGGQWGGQVGPHNIPCTGITEREAIFGAAEQLDEQIRKAQEIMTGDMFMVLTGCSAELIGDDVAEIVSRYKNSDKPVLYAKTGGFLGTNIYGHHIVWESIIKQYLRGKKKEINSRQVNVWGIIPVYDSFWYGTCCEIEKLLTEIGLEPNIVYGPGKGLKAIEKIPNAAFNLVVSPWWDLSTAKLLKEEFDTEYIHYPYMPIGAVETTKFLREIANHASLDMKVVENVIEKHERHFYYCMERAAIEFGQIRLMPRRFINISSSQYAVSTLKFMVNEMGLLPGAQYMTDSVPEEFHDQIKETMKDISCDVNFDIFFNPDGGEIQKELLDCPPRGKQFIFASGWDKTLAKDLDAYFLSISIPVSTRLVMDRTYFGYSGGLRFAEDFYSVILDSYQ